MDIQITGQLVQRVSEFRYLGSLISEDGYCEEEIHSTVAWKEDIYLDNTGKINFELKKRIIKYVALYAVETWMLTQATNNLQTKPNPTQPIIVCIMTKTIYKVTLTITHTENPSLIAPD